MPFLGPPLTGGLAFALPWRQVVDDPEARFSRSQPGRKVGSAKHTLIARGGPSPVGLLRRLGESRQDRGLELDRLDVQLDP